MILDINKPLKFEAKVFPLCLFNFYDLIALFIFIPIIVTINFWCRSRNNSDFSTQFQLNTRQAGKEINIDLALKLYIKMLAFIFRCTCNFYNNSHSKLGIVLIISGFGRGTQKLVLCFCKKYFSNPDTFLWKEVICYCC